jgi:hypothetical protein
MSNKFVAGMAAFVIILGGATAYGFYADANNRAQDAVENLAEKYETQYDGKSTITYGDVKANILDQTATVNDLAFNVGDVGAVVKIASLTFSSEGNVDNKEFPTSMDFHIDGLEVLHDRLKTDLNENMGVDYFGRVINGSFGYHFDKESDVLKPYGNLVIGDINNMSFKTTLSNVRGVWNTIEASYAENKGKLYLDRADRRTVSKMAPKIRINHITFNYTNNGEIENLLEKFAANREITLAEFRTEVPEAIDYYMGDVTFAKDLQVFMSNPKNITFSVTPEKPMTFHQMVERFRMITSGHADKAIEGIEMDVTVNKEA